MPQEAIDAANTLGAKVDVLSENVHDLTDAFVKSQKAARRWRWLTVALVTLSVLTLGLLAAVTVEVRYSTHQASCVRDYANANADRNTALADPLQSKNDALDEFALALAAHDQTQIDRAFGAYVKAVRTYQSAQSANPPPPAPRYAC